MDLNLQPRSGWPGFFGGQKLMMVKTSFFHKQLLAAAGRAQKQVKRFFNSQDPFLQPVLSKAVKTQGKQLRIRMTLLSAQACGMRGAQVEQLAAAWESFHYATLIHDDVIDHSEQRRHQPTLNSQFGNEMAVLVGDLLLTQVLRLLVKKIPPEVQARVAQAAFQVCSGEIHEHRVRGDWRLSEAAYLTIISKKTAALFEACCQTGAMLSKAPEQQISGLAKFGKNFGMAFQIQDDLLDLIGTTQKFGKQVGTDLKEGRVTLPVILGLKHLSGGDRKELLQAIVLGDRKIAVIQQLLRENQIVPRVVTKARAYVRAAQRALNKVPESPAKQELMQMVQAAMDRDF